MTVRQSGDNARYGCFRLCEKVSMVPITLWLADLSIPLLPIGLDTVNFEEDPLTGDPFDVNPRLDFKGENFC